MESSTEFAGLGVRVGDSSIGLGVFATQSFRAHQTVGRVCGSTQADPGYESEYCVGLGDGLSLEPAAPFRYLNHSCEPNCALVDVTVWNAERQADEHQIWVHSLVVIAPGEQLTIDYAWPADVAIRCDCGSRHCRGWVVAEEQIDWLRDRPTKRRRHSPYCPSGE